MTHNTQALIASERERWLKLHLEGGLSMVELAKRSGFARSTLYLWKDAYEKDGLAGLMEKSRAHHAHPKTTAPEMVALIREIRAESPMPGAERIAIRLKKRYGIAMQWRTIHKVLAREGMVRRKKRTKKNEKPIPKATFPGELVQDGSLRKNTCAPPANGSTYVVCSRNISMICFAIARLPPM